MKKKLERKQLKSTEPVDDDDAIGYCDVYMCKYILHICYVLDSEAGAIVVLSVHFKCNHTCTRHNQYK